MAYVYLDDGGPESEDYDSNYFYFDENNRQALSFIEDLLASDAERDDAFREKLNRLCLSSLEKEAVKSEGKLQILLEKIYRMIMPSIPSFEPAQQCVFDSSQQCAQN